MWFWRKYLSDQSMFAHFDYWWLPVSQWMHARYPQGFSYVVGHMVHNSGNFKNLSVPGRLLQWLCLVIILPIDVWMVSLTKICRFLSMRLDLVYWKCLWNWICHENILAGLTRLGKLEWHVHLSYRFDMWCLEQTWHDHSSSILMH